ncbi:MAG: lamin tail domain-containing protein, partial [bacterium]
VSDGSGVDNIVELDDGLILKPGQFAVILAPSYFSDSDTYDDLIPAEALVVTIDNSTFGSRGLSNSSPETITLVNSTGIVVTEYTYSLNNGAGFSDEKIDLAGPDTADNWANSEVLFGTPGGPNSVSPLDFDLEILPEDISFSPLKIQEGESVLITSTIRNVGLRPVAGFEVVYFEDLDGDTLAEFGEELAPPFQFAGSLLAGDSIRFSLNWDNVSPGSHAILVKIDFPADEDTINNLAQNELLVGYSERSIVINEIMYAPLTNQSEWIEVFNRTSQTINLKNWAISDSDSNDLAFVVDHIFLSPNDYFVIAEDSSLLGIFSVPPGACILLKNWPALNNDFDSVFLYDLAGTVVDRVDYFKSWGGGSGLSLERINPDLASNDSLNWSSSVAFEGGTPGSQNSIFTQVLPSEAALSIKPNPFSPDGDGKDDFAVISYELPVLTATVNIKIYDVRGRLIRFLSNNQPSGARNSVIWDGKDDDNQKARMGIYIVFLQALNAEAGLLKTAKKTVVLAGKL